LQLSNDHVFIDRVDYSFIHRFLYFCSTSILDSSKVLSSSISTD